MEEVDAGSENEDESPLREALGSQWSRQVLLHVPPLDGPDGRRQDADEVQQQEAQGVAAQIVVG